MAKIVQFDENGMNARIYHVDDIKPYIGKAHCLIDPVYPRGLSPHQWRLGGGKILTEADLEAKAIEKELLAEARVHKLAIGLSLAALALLSAVMLLVLHV